MWNYSWSRSITPNFLVYQDFQNVGLCFLYHLVVHILVWALVILCDPIVGIKTLAFYGLIRRPTTSYQHSCYMMAITLQKAFELMFYLLTAMLTCKGVFLPVLAGYLLSGIPDGQGIFLKSHLWRPQDPGLGLWCEMPTHRPSCKLCKTQAHPSKGIICLGLYDRQWLTKKITKLDTRSTLVLTPNFVWKNRGTSLC